MAKLRALGGTSDVRARVDADLFLGVRVVLTCGLRAGGWRGCAAVAGRKACFMSANGKAVARQAQK